MTIVSKISGLGDSKIIDELDNQIGKRLIDTTNNFIKGNRLDYHATGIDFVHVYSSLTEEEKMNLKIKLEEAYIDGAKVSTDLKEAVADTTAKSTITKRWVVIIMSLGLLGILGAFTLLAYKISLARDDLPPIEWVMILITPPFLVIIILLGVSNSGLKSIISLLKNKSSTDKSRKP